MKLVLLAMILITTPVIAGINDVVYGNMTASEVTSVYDADTFRVNVYGWPDIIGANMPIRVLGVDAPEIRGKCPSEKAAAKRAKQFTIDFLKNCTLIELRDTRRGKYFRVLANVYVDGKSLADALIRAGHGRYYSGGKRLGWCGK